MNMKIKTILAALLVQAILNGCGGGGGGASAVAGGTPLVVAASSYDNKNTTDPALNIPQIPEITTLTPSGHSIADSLAFGDFFQTGSYSAFVAVSQSGAMAKAYFLKKNPAGGWTDNTSTLLSDSDRSVCSNVVQALTADFNKDGKPDVYVVCGGNTAATQILFLSQAVQSTYTRQETTGINLQAWGAAAADIDGDGDVDVVSTDGNSIVQLTNNLSAGAVSWSKKTQSEMGITSLIDFPTMPRKVFLLPNVGGLADLVVTGNGNQVNNTMVWLKNQSGHFNFNGNSAVSSIADNYSMTGIDNQPIHASVFDLVVNSSNLFVLVKNTSVENGSNATSMVVLRYELPSASPGTQLNLISSLALPTTPYQPVGGLVSQFKPNSSGKFVAFDADCVSTQQRCDFVVTP